MKPLRLVGLAVVALAVALSAASTEGGETGEDGACGELFVGAEEGEECTQKEECTEVCCLCDNGIDGFVAQGCDLEGGTCYGGDTVCQLAFEDEPDLCGSDEEGQ